MNTILNISVKTLVKPLAFKPKNKSGLATWTSREFRWSRPLFPIPVVHQENLRSQQRGKKRRDSKASDAAQLSVKATGHGGPLDVVLWGKKTWISHSLKWENAGHRVSFEKNIEL